MAVRLRLLSGREVEISLHQVPSVFIGSKKCGVF